MQQSLRSLEGKDNLKKMLNMYKSSDMEYIERIIRHLNCFKIKHSRQLEKQTFLNHIMMFIRNVFI